MGTVLVGTDGSERAERAVKAAVAIAGAQDAKLLIVAAFGKNEVHSENVESSAATAKGHLRDVAEQALMRCARHAEEAGVAVEWEALPGDPADVLLDVATSRDVGLIVVGNKGMTGARRYLMGSVPGKISHHAPCSVMIVRTD